MTKFVLGRMRRRDAIGLLLAATSPAAVGAAFGRTASSQVATTDAEGAVQQLATQIWQRLGQADEQARIDAIAALLEGATDVELLSRLVLARYWQQLGQATMESSDIQALLMAKRHGVIKAFDGRGRVAFSLAGAIRWKILHGSGKARKLRMD